MAILCSGLALTCMVGVYIFKSSMQTHEHDRDAVADKLKGLNAVSSSEYPALLEEAFDAFDLSRSGFLELNEARELFHYLFHAKVGPAKFAEIMLTVRQFTDHKGELSFEALMDAMVTITTKHSDTGLTMNEQDGGLQNKSERTKFKTRRGGASDGAAKDAFSGLRLRLGNLGAAAFRDSPKFSPATTSATATTSHA